MFATNQIYVVGVVASAIAALSMAGCSTAGAAGPTEVRVATRLETGSPRLVVAGPARLLHVDVHAGRALQLYRVRRGADGQVSCLGGARTQVRSLNQGASNELNIVVAAGEAICLSDDAAGTAFPRDTEVSWHARSGAARVEIAEASRL